MSTLKADSVTASSGVNTDLALTGKGTGKVALGDAALTVPDTDGSANQYLRTTGSAALEFATLPAAVWTLIGTQEASASASLTQTGLDSTYDTYAIVISDLVPASDNQKLWLRVGDSGGIDSGASDYGYHRMNVSHVSNLYVGEVNATSSEIVITGGVGSTAGEGAGAVLFIHRPGDGSAVPIISGTWTCIDLNTVTLGGTVHAQRLSVITLTQVNILFASGNIASGRMSVYGISHT